MQIFKATFRCAIDEAELLEEGDRETPVTLEELKEYLSQSLIVSFNDEEYGNPVGLQSVEVDVEELEEIKFEEETMSKSEIKIRAAILALDALNRDERKSFLSSIMPIPDRLFSIINDQLDGCGIVVEDQNLLAESIAAMYDQLDPSEVFPNYEPTTDDE